MYIYTVYNMLLDIYEIMYIYHNDLDFNITPLIHTCLYSKIILGKGWKSCKCFS